MGSELTEATVQAYDACHEATPRPLFLHEWLSRPEGKVIVILDERGNCCGYKGTPPILPLGDIYGLVCLEVG